MKLRVACLLLACVAIRSMAVDESLLPDAFASRITPWFESSRTMGELHAADGLVLRWYAIEARAERAAMVVLPGWTETAESFQELLYDLRDLGISFYVPDLRGQGLSGGEITPRDRWHLENWETLLTDLDLLMEKVVMAKPHTRVLLYGDSMGGSIATAWIGRHPAAVQGLVMTVPMFGVRTNPFPLPVVKAIMRLYMLVGKGTSYLPGYGPYQSLPYENNPWSITSRARYDFLGRLEDSRSEYRLGGSTARGGAELLDLAAAARSAAARVTVPALLVQAGSDEMVRNDAQVRAAATMKDCRLVTVRGAHHVIMHMADPIRNQALAAIRSFLQEQVK